MRRKTLPATPSAPATPAPGEGKRGESGYLAYLLRQGAAAARLRLERALADLGVTPSQFNVLTMLKAYPRASGADIARLTFLTPQSVHGVLTNLIRDGLIARAADPAHGRRLRLLPTAKGLDVLSRCRARARAMDAALAADLSEREQAIIRRWLARLAASTLGGEGDA